MRIPTVIFSLAISVPFFAAAAEPNEFASWREFFTRMAGRLDMGQAPDQIFAFAADSVLQPIEGDPSLVLVKANLFVWSRGSLLNRLRGVSDSGPYYLVKRGEKTLKLIGTMDGSSCTLSGPISPKSPTRRFSCMSHLGAGLSRIAQFETDGESFKELGVEGIGGHH